LDFGFWIGKYRTLKIIDSLHSFIGASFKLGGGPLPQAKFLVLLDYPCLVRETPMFQLGSICGSLVGSIGGSLVGAVVGSMVGAMSGSVGTALVGALVGSLAGSLLGSFMGAMLGSVVDATLEDLYSEVNPAEYPHPMKSAAVVG
jgi:hypothetical protein